jgi:hypothetical protein
MVRKPPAHLSRLLFTSFWRSEPWPKVRWHPPVRGHHFSFRRCKARLARHPAHPLDSRHRSLSCRHVALVHRRPTRNPEFFRVFILEHNLARFSQDFITTGSPFWFYLPVFLLATMPWTLVLILAVAERVRLIWSEGKEAFSGPEDSWPLFLLIWMLVPVLFFSASQSKLPGYILPAVPAAALLVAEYLAVRRSDERKSFARVRRSARSSVRACSCLQGCPPHRLR